MYYTLSYNEREIHYEVHMNYYSGFCIGLELPEDANIWLSQLVETGRAHSEQCVCPEVSAVSFAEACFEVIEVTPEEVKSLYQINFSSIELTISALPLDPITVYLESEDSAGSPEDVATLLHCLVRRFHLKPIGFAYACTADRSSIDAYGGGAFWITETGVESIDTQSWLDEKLQQLS